MAINNKKSLPAGRQGFALLVAVIFMSVVLTLGLALGSLGYKQQILASGAIASQYAFYAADAGMECALYADQQLDYFNYASHSTNNPPNVITCDTVAATQLSYSYDASRLYVSERLSLDAGKHCADVTVYKFSSPQAPSGAVTYIFSQGYDVSCNTVATPAGARFVARGVNIHY